MKRSAFPLVRGRWLRAVFARIPTWRRSLRKRLERSQETLPSRISSMRMERSSEPSDPPLQVRPSCDAAFVGQDLGIRRSGLVVDRNREELPANAARLAAAIVMGAMSDFAELIDIDVNELARSLALVAHDGLHRFE